MTFAACSAPYDTVYVQKAVKSEKIFVGEEELVPSEVYRFQRGKDGGDVPFPLLQSVVGKISENNQTLFVNCNYWILERTRYLRTLKASHRKLGQNTLYKETKNRDQFFCSNKHLQVQKLGQFWKGSFFYLVNVVS